MSTHLKGPANGKRPHAGFSSWKLYLLAAILAILWLPAYHLIFHPQNRPMIQIFLLPVIISAYLGGLGPGLLATGIVTFTTNYYLLEPVYSLRVSHTIDLERWFSFALLGILISFLSEALHRVKSRAESEMRLHAVTLASIGDAVITTNERGEITFLNSEAERLTDWKLADAKGQPLEQIFRIVNEQNRRPVENPVKKVLETGTVVGLANHTVLLSKENRETPIDDSGAPIRDTEGKIIGVVLVFRDCGEQKQAEAAIRQSEALYHSLVEQMPAGIFRKSQEGRYVFVNSFFCQLRGMQPDAFLGKLPSELPDSEASFRREGEEHHKTIMRTGKAIEVVDEYHRADGKTLFFHVVKTPIIDDNNIIIGTQGILFDVTAHKANEDKLAQSLSLLQTTFESSSSGILVASIDRHMAICNQLFKDMWKIPPEKGAAFSPEELVAICRQQVDNPESFLKQITAIYERPELDSSDLLSLKDGRVLERTSRPQRLGDKIIGRVWNFRDVTEAIRAEQSIRLQSVALESADNAIVITECDGKIEWVNPAFTRISGYSKSEAVGKNPRELFRSGRHGREFYQNLWQTILSGKVWHGELTNRRKDNSLFVEEMTITPLQNKDQQITHFVAIKQDITRRKRMEEELRLAGERTQFYMNRMPLAFIAWDKDFKVCEWNPAAEKIFGWTAGEAIGQHAFDLIIPLQIRPVINITWNEIMSGSTGAEHISNENVAKDGRLITCEWRNTAWRDASGQICGVLSLADDITDQIKSQKQRTELEAQLRQSQKMEAIGQLSGGIAHDFNNLLTIIQGNASLLQNLDLTPQETRECSTQIVQAAERASDLTRQLLMFARKQQIQPVPLDLNEVLNQINKMLQRVLGEHISLRGEFAADLPMIYADFGMMEQIVLNLAVNARDAMSQGGKLTLRTKFKDERVCLEVADTGVGIAPEVMPRIFDPFFTTKEVGKGTGLGLATVYGIVQQHQGSIKVFSEPGQGTTFCVSFPPLSRLQVHEVETRPKPLLLTGAETILVVEDEPPLRAFVSDLLRRYGYTVFSAESGPSALSVWSAKQREIDLVFTDIVMPDDMNGIDLGLRLKAEKPELKVIYTSGYTGNLENSRNITLIEGVNFIRKPYKPEILAGLIRKKLGEKPAQT